MMGLYDTAYWLSWLSWEGITTLIASLLTVLFGMMFQFDFFSKNNFAIVFLVFFLFQLNMVWKFLQQSFVLQFIHLFLILPLLPTLPTTKINHSNPLPLIFMLGWICFYAIGLYKQVIFIHYCWLLHLYCWISHSGNDAFA